MSGKKITQLNELSAPVAADLIAAVDDPSGSAETKKLTVENMMLGTEDIVPACRATNTVDQTIPNTTWTVLDLNSELFDTDSMHDNAVNNSRITINTPGKYLIIARVNFEPDTEGLRYLDIYLNNTTSIASVSMADFYNANPPLFMFVSTIYDFSVDDYVQARVYQTSGGNLDIRYVASNQPEFSAVRIGD